MRVVWKKLGYLSRTAKQNVVMMADSNRRKDDEKVAPATVLERYYIGTFPVPLDNLRSTTVVRQTNSLGVSDSEKSMKDHGFMQSGAPSVIFNDVQDKSQFTAAEALERTGFVLDGNHRLKAAKKVFPAETLIPCRCYTDIPNKSIKKLLADGECVRVLQVGTSYCV